MAHRDYRSPGNVQVYVFKDRVEIVSPGGLPAGMAKADLGANSLPRNPLLFSMLYRMDVVERVGSGIRRILDRCREHGVPEPVIDVSGEWVTVTFPRPDQDAAGLDCGPEREPETRPESGEEARGKDTEPESVDGRPEAKPDDKAASVAR